MLRCGAPTHTFNSPHLPTLTFPYISPYLPHTPSHFPTPPFIPLPTSLLPPPTPKHIFLLSPHLPSPSQSVAKLPCDEVSVAKLLWRSYHGAKLLAHPSNSPALKYSSVLFKFFSFAFYINFWFKISEICPKISHFSQIFPSRGNTAPSRPQHTSLHCYTSPQSSFHISPHRYLPPHLKTFSYTYPHKRYC